jgi:hypothetical protein
MPQAPSTDLEDAPEISGDPLLSLRGCGKDLWDDEPADEYVNHLGGGWPD